MRTVIPLIQIQLVPYVQLAPKGCCLCHPSTVTQLFCHYCSPMWPEGKLGCCVMSLLRDPPAFPSFPLGPFEALAGWPLDQNVGFPVPWEFRIHQTAHWTESHSACGHQVCSTGAQRWTRG